MNAKLIVAGVFTSVVSFGATAGDVFSDWVADGGVWSGNFSSTAHWTQGVPTETADDVVTGYLTSDTAEDYFVTNDVTRTVPYLRLRNNGAGWLRFVVEKPLTIRPPVSFVRRTSLAGQDEKTETVYGRPIDTDKHVEVVVPKESSLVWRQTTEDNKSSAPYITGGSKITVDGGSLELHDLEYSRKKLYFTGSASATTKVEVANGGKFIVDGKGSNGYALSTYYGDYVRVSFTNSVYESNSQPGATGTAGGPEFTFSGDSVYRFTGSGTVTIIGCGKTSFSGTSCFTNAAPDTTLFIIGPEAANQQCRVDFTDHASAAFSADLTKVLRNNGLYVGAKGDAAVGTRTVFNFASDGYCIVGYAAYVGADNGYAEWNISGGAYARVWGNGGVQIAGASRNNSTSSVTGIVNVAGIGTSLTCRGADTLNSVSGLIVGAGMRASSTDTAAMRAALHHYGELNISDGAVVTNTHSCVVGAGYGKGKLTVRSQGRYVGSSGFQCLIGFGGGEGEFLIDGGSASFGANKLAIGGYPSWFTVGNNFPDGLTDAKGRLSVKNGSATVATSTAVVSNGKCGTGEIELGENGSFSCYQLDNSASGTLKFTFGPTGTGLLTLNGNGAARHTLSVESGATLEVDGRGYRGEAKWVQLVNFTSKGNWGSSQGLANGDRFTKVVTKGDVKVVQNPADDPVRPGVWAHFTSGLMLILR